jgi:hypothetical protein
VPAAGAVVSAAQDITATAGTPHTIARMLALFAMFIFFSMPHHVRSQTIKPDLRSALVVEFSRRHLKIL